MVLQRLHETSPIRGAVHAAIKWSMAKWRDWRGTGIYENWAGRAEICERCPLRRISKGISYCGLPYAQHPVRRVEEGCGCPTHSKAKDPTEHCPLNRQLQVASQIDGKCDCKWCRAGLGE